MFLNRRELGWYRTYPTPWKRRFAIFPTRIAESCEGYLWVWFESYEERQLQNSILERRTLRLPNVKPIALRMFRARS